MNILYKPSYMTPDFKVLDKDTGSRIIGVKGGQIIDLPIAEAVEMKHEHTHGLRDLIDMLQ